MPAPHTIFISCQRIDAEYATAVVQALRAAGNNVLHSPRNPLDGEDFRWVDWYDKGLEEALKSSDSFLIIVDQGWESSSCMWEEARRGKHLYKTGKLKRFCFVNPENCEAYNMVRFLDDEIPPDVDSIVQVFR